MKSITYGQLPQNPAHGVSLVCRCGARASACRGDYFRAEPDERVICGMCKGPMFLGRLVTKIERVSPKRAEARRG